MHWEIIFIFALLGLTVASFVWEKIPTDLTAMIAFGVILLMGTLPGEHRFPTVDELLGVFSSAAPLTIAAMFIISAALEKCGAIERIATGVSGLAKFGYIPVLLVMIFGVAGLSAFINNTPVVVIFLPVVLSLARHLSVPASKLLIPLSYASIFGGVCTLVGTSTNILASDILRSSGRNPISMFELTKLGIPLMILGTIYLAVVGRRILPRRESLTSILSDEERKEYLTEAYVRPASPAIGKSAVEAGLLRGRGIRLLELIRNEVALKEDLKNIKLQAGDRLILSCRPSGFVRASSVEGLNFLGDGDTGLETIAAHEGSIVEGVIAPRSSITGRTIRDLNFRQRFRMILIAIHRRGINMRDKIDTLPLEAGDTILMMGTDEAREEIRRGDDILLLDHPPVPAQDMRKKAPIVIGVLAAIITVVTIGLMPISGAALLGVIVLFLSGAIKPKEGYAAIDWSLLILIYAMLGVGLAMDRTGASQFLADSLINLSQIGISPEMQPYVLLAAMYLMTTLLTEILSNNATVVLMTPIAIGLGITLGVDPRPFVIAACMGSSASFATPIGYQTNTYVYGVGGYKFKDFLKVGIPLNVLYMVTSIVLIPMLWSF
jgi:di/tricarboxylate transporter